MSEVFLFPADCAEISQIAQKGSSLVGIGNVFFMSFIGRARGVLQGKYFFPGDERHTLGSSGSVIPEGSCGLLTRRHNKRSFNTSFFSKKFRRNFKLFVAMVR